MSLEDIRSYYLQLPYAWECFPFDEHTLVVKVGSKMFAYIMWREQGPYLALKCDPERAAWLCQHESSIEPAYHMNKRHWIGLYLHHSTAPQLIYDLIRDAHTLVWEKLSRQERLRLQNPKPN